MKHPVSVEELLELHRLGELYVKWSSNPFAMSERDLEELQSISSRYSIDGTSALFAFQKQFQQEFGLTAENTRPVTEVLGVIMDGLALAEAEKISKYTVPPEVVAEREAYLKDLDKRIADQDAAERNEALAEQIREDNELDREERLQAEVDRKAAAAHAMHLRDELTVNNPGNERELQILSELANVDELTDVEQKRLDELARLEQEQNWEAHKEAVRSSATKSFPIPAGVIQDAMPTGTIKKVK